jgi:dolichyl-phosphate beta-glucosyltransferase
MKTISFVIPVYNEEKRIDKTFEALRNVKLPRGLRLDRVVFVDDGSVDSTFQLISQFSRESSVPITVVSYGKNAGKGNAIRLGMLETLSKSDYALFFDADMSTPLTELSKFLPQFNKGVNVVVGTRKNGHSTVIKHQPLYREVLGKVFTKITQISLNCYVTDFTCGFKAFSQKSVKKIFSNAKINGWGYDAEILFLAKKYGLSMNEVAVTWANDERTKVNLKSAIIKTLLELWSIRWIHTIKPAFKIPARFALQRISVSFKVPAKLRLSPFKI